ncbi:putative transposase/invertase (TIGR01784 family) [Anoxybacillus voinovskiensis]|uniref:Putative transposase/invertase (TIGR01784 family) n=2 Tax=Anoxybacteroides voinovskiense TaxID=230470 RepID=A0A840DVP7_9BACL|nr:Rpn family recombination-promoting nuclease/putative transposase [Anoxybacillus voinovskiensis]MBB4075645.1 putative transposase/invertase (TIGR01784 family) [Anoxybacillus voinovskiensis]
MQYLDLKMDFMFKQLFGHPSRKSITMAFLNALLHRKEDDRIVDVQFENTELTKETEDGKTGRLDVIVRTNRGERIHVEIQIIPQYGMPERLLYYWARLFSSSLSKGERYDTLPPTIMIAILNYPLFPHETDRFHTIFHIREDEEHFLWSDHLEFHVLDLSQFMVKWKKYRWDVKQSPEWPWLTMLSAVDGRTKKVDEEMVRELEGIAMTEQEILEALEEWQSLSVDPENRYAYEMRLKWLLDQLSNIRGSREEGLKEGLKRGLEQGRVEGLKEGMKHKEREMIRKMVEKGMSIADIAHMLDLTEEEVQRIWES